jgi:hypothetical protein
VLGEPCSTVDLDCLCATVTMATKLFTVATMVTMEKVGLDCLCAIATKLFTLGKHGNYDN